MTALRAQSASAAQRLYGTWYVYPPGNPDTDSVRREFRHDEAAGKDELVVTRTCPAGYDSPAVRAVSPIEVSDSTIRVLKIASASSPGPGSSVCRANIDAGVLGYTLSRDGSRITITNPGGKPDLLELARENAASDSLLPANLYGTWIAPVENENDVRLQIRLVFYNSAERDQGKVRQIAICSKGNSTVLSQVDSDISVSSGSITILQSASHEQRDGPLVCRATIASGTLRYAISPDGTSITLSRAGSPPMKLTREGQPGLNW